MKTVIKKGIVLRKRPADWEQIEVSVGYEEEIEYETEEEFTERVKRLNNFISKEAIKTMKAYYLKYWNREFEV